MTDKKDRIDRIQSVVDYFEDMAKQMEASGNHYAVEPCLNRASPLRAYLRHDDLDMAEKYIENSDMLQGWQDPWDTAPKP